MTLKQFQSKGGNARAKALTKSERASIASTAAKARWAKDDRRLRNARRRAYTAKGKPRFAKRKTT